MAEFDECVTDWASVFAIVEEGSKFSFCGAGDDFF